MLQGKLFQRVVVSSWKGDNKFVYRVPQRIVDSFRFINMDVRYSGTRPFKDLKTIKVF